MRERLFYFTDAWATDRFKLAAPVPRRQVQWWDEGEEAANFDRLAEVDIDPTHGRTPREQLDGFVETFVIGWPRAKLIRKQGFGSEPPFKRMWPPRSPVVEMRTVQTRTFGFFSRRGVYVGMRVDLAENTHANKDRLYHEYGDYVMQRLRHIVSSDIDVASDVEDLIGD
jgi:hypothetical protein